MHSRDRRLSRTKERSVKVNASRGFITTQARGTYKGLTRGQQRKMRLDRSPMLSLKPLGLDWPVGESQPFLSRIVK